MADLFNSKILSLRKPASLLFYLLPIALCLLAGVNAGAQETPEEQVPANLAPPPLKILSKEEKSALDASSDLKDRTKLSLELMEARLKKAEELNTDERYNALLSELGGFQALMDDALKYLNRNDDGRGKVMNTFKKFEMSLRAFTPRLELIRREMPERFEYHVRKILIFLRDTRSKAVEPLFSNTVVPSGGN
jgi:hypothetical protein